MDAIDCKLSCPQFHVFDDRQREKKTKNEHWLKRQSSKAWIIFQNKSSKAWITEQGERDMQHMLFTRRGAIKC